MTEAGERGGRRAFGALRHRDFRLLWCSAVGFHISNWMQQVAQNWLLYELTGSAILIGLNGLLRTVPFLVMSLYAGSIVDRTDRRKLLMGVEVVLCLMTLVLGLLVLTGAVEVWHIYAFSVSSAIFGAFEIPAQHALLPHTVPRQDLMTAVALNSMLRRGTQIIGPALGGVFIAAFGVAETYLLNCVGYLGFIVALALMRATNPVDERAKEPPLQAIAAGLHYVRSDAVIGTLLPLEAVFSLFGSFNPLIVVLAREVYHVGAEGFGLLQSAPGIGTVAGSLLLAFLGDVRQKGRLMIGAAMVYGASVIGFAFCPFFAVAVVLLALSGAADFIRGTARTTTLQLFARGPMLGRVMSLDGMATRGLGQMGGFTAGSMSSLMGPPWALTIGAVLCIGATLGVAWRNPKVRNLTEAPQDMSASPARV
jgi:MFS family permease